MGSGRTGVDGAGAVDGVFSVVEGGSGGSFDTDDTVTRVPTLPEGEPDVVPVVIDGFMLRQDAPDSDRNVLVGGITGTIREP